MLKILKFIITINILLLLINCSSCTRFVPDQSMYSKSIDSIDVEYLTNTDDVPPPFYVEVDKVPQPIHTQAPNYPEELRRAGVEGTVWVRLWVNKSGMVKRATVIYSEDNKFNRSALNTALLWRFTPAVDKSGKNRDVWVSIPFKYRIRN